MDWEINIRKADNGYVCKYPEEDEEGKEIMKESLFEEKELTEDDGDENLISTREMLLFVKEYFGSYYSKHNKKNLVIEIKEEDKEEDDNSK